MQTDIYASMPSTLPEPAFDDNALRVLNERYFAIKPDGLRETPREFLWRVAYAVAQPEAIYLAGASDQTIAAAIDRVARAFYDMLVYRDFMPNTPCLINAGRPLSMLSACFVLGVPDSMDGIYSAIKDMALIQRSGGGTGFAFSQLRQNGAHVVSTGKDASGPLSFLKVFNAATDSIKQGGVRRGANMGVLAVDHPDILEFISCKKELDMENRALYNRLADTKQYTDAQLTHIKQELLQTQMNNFNISIGISDTFMEAVENDLDFDLLDPRDKTPVKTIRARVIFDAIVAGAYQNGEPGILFLDHPKLNPLPGLGPILATNPCGEQALHAGDSCNLGSINVGNYFDEPTRSIDWERLSRSAKIATHFLDNVIDAGKFAIEDVATMVKNNRRIGLGIMGFADLLAKLHIRYGSPKAIALAEDLMLHLYRAAEEASVQLALIRGDFPNKHLSIYAGGPPRRNAALLSIAPTGTISMIAGCSFGCEPYFGIAYTKHVMKDAEGRAQQLYYVLPLFEEMYRDTYGTDVPQELLAQVAANNGSLQNLDIDAKFKQAFSVAADVTVDEHIDMLAAFQKNTCNAVSKTINAPNSDTKENVVRSILRAYKKGCKGFTYYRDGSRTEQVVTFSSAPAAAPAPQTPPPVTAAEPTEIEKLLTRAKAVLAG